MAEVSESGVHSRGLRGTLFAGVLLLTLAAAYALTQPPPPSFAAAGNFAAGASPYSVAVADFNGDGKPDLVVADHGGGVSVLLGNGDGTYQAAVSYAAGTTPSAVAVADFNGDGKPDLVVADQGGGVSVLLGNGNGTFQAAASFAAGTTPASVAVGDFNGDGKPDLAVADQGGGVSVLLGNGDGTFQPAASVPAGANPVAVAAVDFNNDGKLDLAVADQGGGVSVLLGNGNGTFQAAVSYGAGIAPTAVAVGDFNGDGHPDVAITDQGGGVSVLLGNGDGTLRTALSFALGTNPTALAVGNFNGDSKLDLAVTDSNGGVSVLLGNGDGTFLVAPNYPAGTSPYSVAVADFNGDGKRDLAVADQGGGVDVLLGNGDGTFQAAVNYAAGTTPAAVAAADFNGDGKPDLAVADQGGGVSVLLGNGNGTFQTAVNYAAGTTPAAVAVADFNGDGKPDLAVADQGGGVSVLPGNGNGTFQTAVNYAAGTTPTAVAVADFNGDGKPDLAVADQGGGVSVLLGNGNGTFQTAVNYAAGTTPTAVAVADFNGDGKLDLAVADQGGGVSVLLGNGNGTFQPAVNYPAGNTPYAVAAADLNSDGNPDLAVADLTGGVSVLAGNGDGTFQAAVGYAAGNSPTALALGDFNGDGKPDLAIAELNSGVGVLLNTTASLANQTPLTLNASSPLPANQSETLSVSGGSTGGAVTYSLVSGPCSIAGNQLTANSSTGSCMLTATMAGNSSYSAVTSSPANTVALEIALPGQVTGLSANPGNGLVKLSWAAPTGATGYTVSEGTASGAEAPVATVTTTSYAATGLTNGTTYYFTVAASSASGTGPASSEISATPVAGTTPQPTFNPAGGTYTSVQSVTLSDTNSAAAIYYTTNGSTPSAASTAYTGPINVSASTTIRAIAIAPAYAGSSIASAQYVLNLPAAATPTFSPAAGLYIGTQSVTLSDTTGGATIYYTTDGSTPTSAGTAYTGPISVATTETVKAIAVATGYSNSAVGSALYTIKVASPTFSLASGTYTGTQSVTLSDTASGASIYYTTDGTTPTTASTLYTGPVSIATTTTLEAIAAAPGNSNSGVAAAVYTIKALTPTFSPAAGTYTSIQSVSISDATSGATIYYTTNGATPTTSSTPYTGPINVAATANIQAIAAAPGVSNSAVGVAAYTINLPAAATPAFSLATGTYIGPQSVTLSDTTGGATIYYTTDGSTPTSAGTAYTGPISVATSETVKAIAVATGYSNSAVGSALYTIKVANPTFSLASGTYTGTQSVTLSDTAAGASIYYTTNGTTPTTASTLYTGPVSIATTTTLEAIAAAPGNSNSGVAAAVYTIKALTPTFSPAAGTYTSIQSVSIGDATSGAVIYYTTNGATPTTSSTPYTGPISVGVTANIQAIAAAPGVSNSAVGVAAYTINLPAAATPAFSLAAGTYTGPQSVTLSDTTGGATIYYTTDGSTPTSAGTAYTGPISVAASETIKAIAVAAGYSNSAVGSSAYTIQVAAPTFSPAPGTYTSTQSVTLSDTTPGAAIYYTTNRKTPSTSSIPYTGPISVGANTTIEAIAAVSGDTNSDVVTGYYYVNLPTAATPTFSPASGSYTSVQSVTISDTSTGASIYYTTDGSTPTTASTLYTGPITVNASTLIKAIAAGSSYVTSALAGSLYTLHLPPTVTPTISPAAGTYSTVQSVTISDTASGAAIYYTTNGTTPTTASTLYTGPIDLGSTATVQAIAVAQGDGSSAVASAAYTINLPAAATPTLSLPAGSYSGTQSVTISDTTGGASIYYTTDGSTPNSSSTLYTGPISVSTSMTLQAIAIAPDYAYSAVASAQYTIISSKRGLAYVANNTTPGTVSVIDNATASLVATIPVGNQPTRLTATPDNSEVFVSNSASASVSVLSTATINGALSQSVIATIPVGQTPGYMAVSPNGQQLYVSNRGSNSVTVINIPTNTVIGTVNLPGNAPWAIEVSPDGKHCYVSYTGANLLSVIDTTTLTDVADIQIASGSRSLAVSPDSSQVYVSQTNLNAVAVINASTNKVITSVASGYRTNIVAVTPDGSQVFSANPGTGVGAASGTVNVFSTATDDPTATITVGPLVWQVVLSADATTAYTASSYTNSLYAIDIASDTLVATIPVGSAPYWTTVSNPAGSVYVTNPQAGTVTVIDTLSNSPVATIATGTNAWSAVFVNGPVISGSVTKSARLH